MADKPNQVRIAAGEDWELLLQPAGRFEFRWNWGRKEWADGVVGIGGHSSTGSDLFEVWGRMLWLLTPEDAARFVTVLQSGAPFLEEAHSRQRQLKAKLSAARRAAERSRADAALAELAELRALLEGGVA